MFSLLLLLLLLLQVILSSQRRIALDIVAAQLTIEHMLKGKLHARSPWIGSGARAMGSSVSFVAEFEPLTRNQVRTQQRRVESRHREHRQLRREQQQQQHQLPLSASSREGDAEESTLTFAAHDAQSAVGDAAIALHRIVAGATPQYANERDRHRRRENPPSQFYTYTETDVVAAAESEVPEHAAPAVGSIAEPQLIPPPRTDSAVAATATTSAAAAAVGDGDGNASAGVDAAAAAVGDGDSNASAGVDAAAASTRTGGPATATATATTIHVAPAPSAAAGPAPATTTTAAAAATATAAVADDEEEEDEDDVVLVGMKAVVADPCAVTRRFMKMKLQQLGMDVVALASGEEVMNELISCSKSKTTTNNNSSSNAQAKKKEINVIVLEEEMMTGGGKMLGSRAIKLIREQFEYSEVLVLCSVSAQQGSEEYFITAGADAVWPKPTPSVVFMYHSLRKLFRERQRAATESAEASAAALARTLAAHPKPYPTTSTLQPQQQQLQHYGFSRGIKTKAKTTTTAEQQQQYETGI